MRRAHRLDAVQSHIVGALIRCGCEVQSLAMVGDGCADLLVHHKATKRVLLIECKDGAKPPSARKLTPDQEEWHKRFPVIVVNSAEEAVAALAPIPEAARWQPPADEPLTGEQQLPKPHGPMSERLMRKFYGPSK